MESETLAEVLNRREKATQELASYLKDSVGDVLSRGLAATVMAQPEDAPSYLANWLLRYVEEERYKTAETEARKALAAERALKARQREQHRLQTQARATRFDSQGLSASDREALAALDKALWIGPLEMQHLLNSLKASVGATAAYVGRVEDQAAVREGQAFPGLRFIAADDASSFLVNQSLTEEEGALWAILNDKDLGESGAPHEEEAENAESEDSDLSDGEGGEQSSRRSGEEGRSLGQDEQPTRDFASASGYPHFEELFVPHVIDEPRVKFFSLTRPGSLAAVSIQFRDVANLASVKALAEWTKIKRERNQALEEARLRREARLASQAKASLDREEGEEEAAEASEQMGRDFADEDNNGEGEEDAEELELEPLPPLELSSSSLKLVLCVDSLGQDEVLSDRARRCLRTYAERLGAALRRTQRGAVEARAEALLDSVSRSQEGETLASLEESCSQAVAELRDHFVQEAIRLVEEREAAEAAEFEERRNQRALERRLRKTAREGEKEANQTEEPDEGEQEEEDPQDSERTADEEEEKDTPSLQRLPRELVEEAASGEASLRAFNETVLTPFKTHIASLETHFVAEYESLIPVVAAAALLIGHPAETLRENPTFADSPWSWTVLRRLCATSLVDEMVAFDPKAPRFFENSANGLSAIADMLELQLPEGEELQDCPSAQAIHTWVSTALDARRRCLRLHREEYLRRAQQQGDAASLPPLQSLDKDFEAFSEEAD